MKTIKLITKIIGLFIFTSGVNSLFAEQIQVSTTFTCSTNADCKSRCEALGSDHSWNSRQRTCTKRRKGTNIIKLTPLAKEKLGSLSVVTKNAKAIHQAGEIVKEQAERLNPALRAKPFQFRGAYIPGNNKVSSCACLKACDGNGENCSACSCSPAGCGTC